LEQRIRFQLRNLELHGIKAGHEIIRPWRLTRECKMLGFVRIGIVGA